MIKCRSLHCFEVVELMYMNVLYNYQNTFNKTHLVVLGIHKRLSILYMCCLYIHLKIWTTLSIFFMLLILLPTLTLKKSPIVKSTVVKSLQLNTITNKVFIRNVKIYGRYVFIGTFNVLIFIFFSVNTLFELYIQTLVFIVITFYYWSSIKIQHFDYTINFIFIQLKYIISNSL